MRTENTKNQTKKLREALEKTVSLELIDEKMEYKLIRYFNKEHRKSYSPKNRASNINLDDTQAIFSDIKYRGSEAQREELKLDAIDAIGENSNISAIEEYLTETKMQYTSGNLDASFNNSF